MSRVTEGWSGTRIKVTLLLKIHPSGSVPLSKLAWNSPMPDENPGVPNKRRKNKGNFKMCEGT